MKLDAKCVLVGLGVSVSLLSACTVAPVVTSTSVPTVSETVAPTSIPTDTATPIPGVLATESTDLGLPDSAVAWMLSQDHIWQVAYSPNGDSLGILISSGIVIYRTNPLSTNK